VKRNLVVLTIMVAALALMVWAGIVNYRARQRARMQVQSLEAVLSQPQPTAGAESEAPDSADPLQGKQAPNFTLVDLQGKKVSLDQYRGKAVVIDFWATWCGPCKVEIPWFEQFQTQYAPQGLTVLGVSTDPLDDPDPSKTGPKVAAFVQQNHMNYPVLLVNEQITRAYGGLDVIPMSFFIDRTGKVVASTMGLAPRDEIEADIQKALATGGHA
jgi:thiol-disulfide isomerase/thioredoxin